MPDDDESRKAANRAEISKGIDWATGQAVRNGQALEMIADGLLAEALGISIRAAALLQGSVGLGRTLGMLKALKGEPECRIPADLLGPWLEQADIGLAARNRVVHRAFLHREDGSSMMVGKRYQLEERSLLDIFQDSKTLADAADAGADLLQRLQEQRQG